MKCLWRELCNYGFVQMMWPESICKVPQIRFSCYREKFKYENDHKPKTLHVRDTVESTDKDAHTVELP